MITAQELRIGNFVCYGDDADSQTMNVVIQQIFDDGVDTGYRKRLSFDKIFPIAITPDWLSRAGFFGESSKWRTVEPFRHHIVERDGKYFYRVPGVTLREVKYVHEVMNLYFYITGTELTIKQ